MVNIKQHEYQVRTVRDKKGTSLIRSMELVISLSNGTPLLIQLVHLINITLLSMMKKLDINLNFAYTFFL